MTTVEDYILPPIITTPEQLLTGAAAARTLGISRQRVHQLRHNPGFPKPLGKAGNSIVWLKLDIEAWGQREG